MKKNYDIEALHSYTSLFMEGTCNRVIRFNDYTPFNQVICKFDDSKIGKYFVTYWDYIQYVYKILMGNYRNEYIYKNCFLNDILIKHYSFKTTVAFSEFKVGASIADLALFNGSSRAFEIKTELDSSRRLDSQLEDYSKLFEECYVVIPSELLSKYERSIGHNVGIILFRKSERGRYKMDEYRPASKNNYFDYNVMMKSVRCQEYMNITNSVCGRLPEVSCFEMYDACKEMLSEVDQMKLRNAFLKEMKRRKNNTSLLPKYNKEIRQLCLSLNLDMKKYMTLMSKFNYKINY
jgi:hypothetical protein